MKKAFLAIVSGLLLTACFHTPPPSTPPTTESTQEVPLTQTTPDNPNPTDTMVEEVDFDLDLQNFSFSPNVIEARPGDTIRVRLNVIEGFHDFVIDELDVASSQLSQGQQEIVEITIPANTPSGTEFEFYCSVGNHRALGMVGTISVQ